jgi:hypothetical protein
MEQGRIELTQNYANEEKKTSITLSPDLLKTIDFI